MQATDRQITSKQITSVPLPAEFPDSAFFIDGIPLAPSTDYRSAALIGSRDPRSASPKIGIFARHKDAGYFAQTPPDGISGWPDMSNVSAICGVTGGMVALATDDNGSMSVLIHNTPVATGGGWDRQYNIGFDGIQGTIQLMLERNNKIYGFIKGPEGSPHAFFFSEVGNRTAQWFPCDAGAAAAQAFYPIPSGVPQAVEGLRRIAVFNETPNSNAGAVNARVYAIDETRANVLHVALDSSGAPIATASNTSNVVTTFPLAKKASWGILVDDTYRKAYCRYTTDHGYIMPYTIGEDGSLTRGQDTINGGGFETCPSVDSNLQLLYTVAAVAYAAVYDVATDTQVNVRGDRLPLGGTTPSTWADPEQGILYVAGSLDAPQNVVVFQISAE